MNILTPGESFAAPEGLNPTYTVKLPEKRRFNMFEISEVIECGHRIRGFRVEALVEGGWRTLFDGKCIGYKWSEYFDAVQTDTVRISIYDAKDIPLLRSFSLHLLDTSVFAEEDKVKSGKDLAKGKSAKINYSEGEVEVEFGGVYPFNTVTFNGTGMWTYEIHAFDGSNYQCIFKGVKPHRNQITKLDATVKTSYKMKLVTSIKIDPDKINIGVFDL